jgi:hypothetical protein
VEDVKWTTIRAPKVLTPFDISKTIEEVVQVVGQGQGPVYVAVQGPIPLAFGIGVALQPLAENFRFCQLQETEYVVWFTGNDARI